MASWSNIFFASLVNVKQVVTENLRQIIFNLREEGNAIITKNITRKGKTFAEYSLVQ